MVFKITFTKFYRVKLLVCGNNEELQDNEARSDSYERLGKKPVSAVNPLVDKY